MRVETDEDGMGIRPRDKKRQNNVLAPSGEVVGYGDQHNEQDELPPCTDGSDKEVFTEMTRQERQTEVVDDEEDVSGDDEKVGVEGGEAAIEGKLKAGSQLGVASMAMRLTLIRSRSILSSKIRSRGIGLYAEAQRTLNSQRAQRKSKISADGGRRHEACHAEQVATDQVEIGDGLPEIPESNCDQGRTRQRVIGGQRRSSEVRRKNRTDSVDGCASEIW